MIQLDEYIWIGTTNEARDVKIMDGRFLKFDSILSCTTMKPPAAQAIPGVLYGMVDEPDYTPWSEKEKAYAAGFIHTCVSQKKKVFVHSDMGQSRCAAAVYQYLTRYKNMPSSDALTFIQGKSPKARPNPIVLSTPPVAPPLIPQIKDMEVVEKGLSVVLVTWNRKDVVKQCVESILSSTPEPFEFVVVDNGSTDGTAEYIQQYLDKIRCLRLPANFGKGFAANLGIRMSRGQWICYFDSDVVVKEGWLDEIKSAYERIPMSGWLSLPFTEMKVEEGFNNLFEGLVSGGMMFMDRKVWNEVGGMPEDRLYGFVDIDYARTVRAKGYKVGYIGSTKRLIHLGGEKDTTDYQEWKELHRHQKTPPPALIGYPPVDIIMVRFNLPDIEGACIRSVLEHTTDWAYCLTVVDNYGAKMPLGVLWNRLIEQSPCDYVCLLNSDTLVTEGWLNRLMSAFADPKAGIVGPSTNFCGTKQARFPMSTGLKPEEATTWSETVADEYRGQSEDSELSGFCYLLKKEVWQKIGGFKTEFGFYGQETEFNIRARYAGYKTLWRKDAFVYHYGGASVKAAQERGEMDQGEERSLGMSILSHLLER